MVRARRSRRRAVFIGIVALMLAALVGCASVIFRQEKRNVALIAAIHRKDASGALSLISAGADPNMIDSGAVTFTMSSVWHRMVDRFHGRHAASGPSALDLAVQANLSSVACALLKRGAVGANDRVIVRDDEIQYLAPLLVVAAERHDYNLATLLVLHGADVNRHDISDAVPLFVAASNEDLAMVTLLVAHHADPSAYDMANPPPLIGALARDAVKPDVVRFLLDHGANPNGDGRQYVPLMNTGRADVVAELIAHGANVRMRDEEGDSPVAYAAYYDNWAGVKLLVEHGADVDDHDGSGETPLYLAARAGRADQVAFLLRHGARVNWRGESGGALLFAATEAGSLATVRLLLAHGVTMSAHDDDDRTALHMGASTGNAELTSALIRAGSPINARDIIGETALDEAEEAGNTAAAAILRSAGGQAHRSAQHIPAIGHILGLRLGYAGEDEMDLRLGKGRAHTGGHSNSGRTWNADGASIGADGFDNSDTGYIVDSIDVSDWQGRLGAAAPFRRWGAGPWGNLRIGMSMVEARAALRSVLPPPTVRSDTLSWTADADGRRERKSAIITYTVNLTFGEGLRSLQIEIEAR